MLALGAVLVSIVLTGVAVLIFLIWVLHEHRDASQYRRLIKLHEYLKTQKPIVSSKGWTITYKENRATKSVTVDGVTEAEAMQRACREHHIRYDRIISMVKV